MALKELAVISPIVSQAKALKINTIDDLTKSAQMLTKCNQYLDKLTEEKKKLTDPLNQTLKEVRLRYKPTEEKLTTAIEYLRSEQSRYQTALINDRLAAEKAIADRILPGRGNLSLESAVAKIGQLEAPQGKVELEGGSLSFMAKDEFEVVDITKLPKEYLLANEVKIRADMKAGTRIAGVRYFTVQIPKNNRN